MRKGEMRPRVARAERAEKARAAVAVSRTQLASALCGASRQSTASAARAPSRFGRREKNRNRRGTNRGAVPAAAHGTRRPRRTHYMDFTACACVAAVYLLAFGLLCIHTSVMGVQHANTCISSSSHRSRAHI